MLSTDSEQQSISWSVLYTHDPPSPKLPENGDLKTVILSWLQNDGTRGFSIDQLKGKQLSLTFWPAASGHRESEHLVETVPPNSIE